MKIVLILTFMFMSMLACTSGFRTAWETEQPKATVKGVTIPIKNSSFLANAEGEISDWAGLEHSKGASYTFVADTHTAYSKPSSARIRRHGNEIFGLLAQTIRIQPEWLHKKLQLSGYLKAEKVDGTGGTLVLQTTGGGGNVLTHNPMNIQRIKGNQPWKVYTVEISIPANAYFIRVGALLEDGGTLWVDDLKLELFDQ